MRQVTRPTRPTRLVITLLTAALFANRFPDARIICLEPDDANVEILRLNIAPYPNLVALRAALWAYPRKPGLYTMMDVLDLGAGSGGG